MYYILSKTYLLSQPIFLSYLGAGYQLPKVQAESLVLIDSKVKLDPFTFRVHVDEPSLTFKVKLINSNVTWKLIFFSLLQTLLQTFLFTFSCMYSKTFLLYNSSFFESYITICICFLKAQFSMKQLGFMWMDLVIGLLRQMLLRKIRIDHGQIQPSPHTQWGYVISIVNFNFHTVMV